MSATPIDPTRGVTKPSTHGWKDRPAGLQSAEILSGDIIINSVADKNA